MPAADRSLVEDLVLGSRILAEQGVVDAFGHVSARSNLDDSRFLISCSRSPELVCANDIMVLNLDGTPADSADGRQPFLERFIHGAIYEARPNVRSVVHCHAQGCVVFSASEEPLRPLMHVAGAIGSQIPVWDIRASFGDTNLLVGNMAQGRELAACLGDNPVALMRGHGAVVAQSDVKAAVLTSIYLCVNANAVIAAKSLGAVNYLSEAEVALTGEALLGEAPVARAWEYFGRRVE